MAEWYKSYNVQISEGYWVGSEHGTIIETLYDDENNFIIQKLVQLCKEYCQTTWSVGYFPTKYSGITFRFFSKEDIKMFEKEKDRLEKMNG